MSVDTIYASSGGNWLTAKDLAGQSHRVEISEVELIEVKEDDGTATSKIQLSFKGKDKGLLLNKTNAKAIASGLGDDEDSWAGNVIIMFPTTCEFGGNTVPCIRVRLDEVMAEEDVPF
jgi:hypothetical protein|tara:strand:+ start:6507 stop:6860 length:354 start_codon:yes stop_codon:yes gene_type:complete